MEKKKFNTKKSTRKGSVIPAFKRSNGRYKKSSSNFGDRYKKSTDKKDNSYNKFSNPYKKSFDNKKDDRSNKPSRPFGKPSYKKDDRSNKPSRPYNRSSRSSNASRVGRVFQRPQRRSKGQLKSIEISSFIEKAQRESQNNKVFEIINTFNDFEFDENVKKNLQRMGFVTPTPIQDGSIVHILAGEDLLGLANTGTGKTGAFLLPLISKVLQNNKNKVLIIAPTRELVLQIDNEFRQFAQGTKIYSATIIGGVSSSKQIHNLLRKPNFVFGTPGRLKDLADRKALRLIEFNNVVLDEVDRMLDMGFLPTVKEIVSKTNEEKQTLCFSATMPEPIKKLAQEFLHNPIVVERQAGRTTASVKQEIVTFNDNTAKFNELKRIIEEDERAKILVFSETKRSVEQLTTSLIKLGVKVDSIHGDKSQYQRQRALAKFKEDKINVLVATDVAARGLDIKGVKIVVNYTIPQSYDDYVHRIGRTGRASAKGRAITFVTK